MSRVIIRKYKDFPYKRVCAYCRQTNILHTLCRGCKKYKKFLHPSDYAIVDDFYREPNLITIQLNFNFKNTKSLANFLNSLSVPVKTYTLHYVLRNLKHLKNIDAAHFFISFHLNHDNKKFLLEYRHLITDEKKQNYYNEFYQLLLSNQSLRSISRQVKIGYEAVYLLSKFVKEKKIIY